MPFHPLITGLLTPFSWGYGLIVSVRNFLYDNNILPSYRPDIPVIVVGNLIAGGTGKTPVVAWLARELSKEYRVAVLSRGYRRSSGGFHLLGESSTPETAGDEPMELRLLLPGIPIAVDRNRVRGIRELSTGRYGRVDLVIMDDGFQHRKVTPGFGLLLDDAERPMEREKMIPAGLRREPLSGIRRADRVVRTIRRELPVSDLPQKPFILVTGIARSKSLAGKLSASGNLIRHLEFPDHHRYTPADAAKIRTVYDNAVAGSGGVRANAPEILTTGKDYVKLIRIPGLTDLPISRIPYEPPMDPSDRETVLKQIRQYVEATKRNR